MWKGVRHKEVCVKDQGLMMEMGDWESYVIKNNILAMSRVQMWL